MVHHALLPALCFASLASMLLGQDTTPPIPRVLPPAGLDVPGGQREELLRQVEAVEKDIASAVSQDASRAALRADLAIFPKAVRFAVEHGEFWKEAEIPAAADALAECRRRLEALRRGETPWTRTHGLVVRGYRSGLDGSVQPYGLVIPESLDLAAPAPLYVWLHGRADRTTDLQFIRERSRSPGQIQPDGAIVLHPFGRYCNAFKSAGEVDVLEAIASVRERYTIDPDRIVLMGFSMGGAGAWHLGAHHADSFVAVSPGAGFAETARYNRLTPDRYPPWYEQTLWHLHDVPSAARNLFNVELVCYSGENDRQIQAARVMEEAFREHGRELRHVIGPGMGHKYHPDSLAEILRVVDEAVRRGRDPSPRRVTLQTRTLRYNRMFWVEALGLERHWEDSRIDAERRDDGSVVVTTRNISALRLGGPSPTAEWRAATLRIDEDTMTPAAEDDARELVFERADGAWRRRREAPRGLRKGPGLQGPIDDAFLEPFLVVTPSGTCASTRVQHWVERELAHFTDRWRRLFRGDLRVERDRDVTPDDLARYNVVLWGDASANTVVARLLDRLPIEWTAERVRIGARSFDASHHVPVMVFPNPLAPSRYVVLNSGITFREQHDRTNSQQNPKLPDWAVLDVSQPPDGESAGRVVAADFFDERWRVRASPRE